MSPIQEKIIGNSVISRIVDADYDHRLVSLEKIISVLPGFSLDDAAPNI